MVTSVFEEVGVIANITWVVFVLTAKDPSDPFDVITPYSVENASTSLWKVKILVA
jgi:hypothetical protein